MKPGSVAELARLGLRGARYGRGSSCSSTPRAGVFRPLSLQNTVVNRKYGDLTRLFCVNVTTRSGKCGDRWLATPRMGQLLFSTAARAMGAPEGMSAAPTDESSDIGGVSNKTTPDAVASAGAGSRGGEHAVKRGDVLPGLKVVSLAFGSRGGLGGAGVTRLRSGLVVFVHGTAPGDVVTARVVRVKRSFVEAILVSTESSGAAHVAPRCPLFGTCGGCRTQHVAVDRQLEGMQAHVEAELRSAGVDAPILPAPAVTAQQAFRYRNRMDFTAAAAEWHVQAPVRKKSTREASAAQKGVPPGFVLGLYPATRGAWHGRVVDVARHGCLLQHPFADVALDVVQRLAVELQVRAFDDRSAAARAAGGDDAPHGVLKQVTLRTAARPGHAGEAELLIVLHSASPEVSRLQPLADAIAGRLREEQGGTLVGVVATHTPPSVTRADKRRLRDAMPGDDEAATARELKRRVAEMERPTDTVLVGRGTLDTTLAGVKLRVSPRSFFQPNPHAAEVIYAEVARAAELTGVEVVCDLFCGTGSIGLSLAHEARSVVGVDVSAPAIADARANARRNGLTNATFIEVNLDALSLDSLAASVASAGQFTPDVCIVDPPRAGLHKSVVQMLRNWPGASTPAAGPSRLVYVSCNPATLARDLALLTQPGTGAWAVEWARPVAQFPNTQHVEVVAALSRA